ncbi:MAG: hypothetical protein L6Q38_02515 [Nitrospira sp.]|nr:hypothetical protein [Planctomycetota bacterium]MCK6498334.1 hypothetical protein [Nitrospira sp.]
MEDSANPKGIKESLEVLRACKDVAVLVYKAKKAGGSVAELGQRIAGLLMTNPQAVQDLQNAAEGIGEVPAEMKDLSLLEAFQFIAEAGKLSAEAAAEIQAA